MNIELPRDGDHLICPYCETICEETARKDERLHQFDQAQDAVSIVDVTLFCPTCRIRIHRRVQAL